MRQREKDALRRRAETAVNLRRQTDPSSGTLSFEQEVEVTMGILEATEKALKPTPPCTRTGMHWVDVGTNICEFCKEVVR